MIEPSGGHTYRRPAYGIERLVADVDAMAPHRSTTHDGILGDQRHAAEHSGHNPNAAGVVCAVDITHDPAHGADAGDIAENIRLDRDDRLGYAIFNGRIFAGPEGPSPFVWRTYHVPPGGSRHEDHVHVSLRQDPHYYDDDGGWEIMAGLTKDEVKAAVREVLAEELVTAPGETGEPRGTRKSIPWAITQVWGHLLRTERKTG
jgi:hypothetical protein